MSLGESKVKGQELIRTETRGKHLTGCHHQSKIGTLKMFGMCMNHSMVAYHTLKGLYGSCLHVYMYEPKLVGFLEPLKLQ